MPDLNKVILIGAISRDTELRYTQQGQAVCNFGLAIKSPAKDKEGNWIERTTYINNLTLWGDRAEEMQPKLRKGVIVAVDGKLMNQKTGKQVEGKDQYELRVSVAGLEILFGGGEKSEQSATQDYDAATSPGNDDLPF